MRWLDLTIACCAYWTLTGWVLSELHALSAAGYACALASFVLVLLAMGRRGRLPAWSRRDLRRAWRRLQRPLPALFALLALASLVGGLAYAPSNHDALSYRVPKLLNWLWAGHAAWIDTPYEPTNYTASNHEWLGLALFALTRSLRPYFLVNWIAFCFLPALIFRVLRAHGVSPRVAATWMWPVASCHGFALQSGGIGNDLLSAFYFLAALDSAARVRRAQQTQDLLGAGLALALCTGVKLSNLPLVLPVTCVLGTGALRRARGWPAWVGGCVVAAVSALPTLLRNLSHTGTWIGTVAASDRSRHFGASLLGNALGTFAEQLNPPVSPWSAQLGEWFVRALPSGLVRYVQAGYPHYAIHLNELPQEERAGLGFGVGALVLCVLAAALRWRGVDARPPRWAVMAVLSNGLGYLLVLGMLSIGTTRIALPYYPLLLVPVLWLASARHVLASRAFRALAFASLLSSLVAVVVQPARPLWPALRTLDGLASAWPAPVFTRARVVYAVYRQRPYALTALLASLPIEGQCVGALIGGDVLEGTLWLPDARHCVRHLRPTGATTLRAARGLQYLVVRPDYAGPATLAALERGGYTVRARRDVRILAAQPSEPFLLLQARPQSDE